MGFGFETFGGGGFRFMFHQRTIQYIATLWLAAIPHAQSLAGTATGQRAVLATVHPLATAAGMKVFRDGGNAMDAAVAAALTLGVVDGHNSGIGGGCVVLIRSADGKLVALDGRETAPARATRDMFLRDGKGAVELSQTGPLSVAVPGALAAFDILLKEFGTKELAELLRPAAGIAERGFAIDRIMAQNLRSSAPDLRRFEESRRILLRPDGSPLAEGQTLVQPDLARTYRAIAEHGSDWFYRGPFADRVEQWMRDHGGILTAADLRNYRAIQRPPIVSTYRGYTIVGFPPPSAGGIHVAEILNILQNFDVPGIWRNDPSQFVHLFAEASKLAMADRAHWLGDADFVAVPRGLIDSQYASELAAKIDLGRTTRVPGHGLPTDWRTNVFSGHTTHIAAADGDGNWIALTATINTSFGSKVIVPGTGVILNNEMDDFAIQPNVPNAYGLIGAENNSIHPGKRPLSSMSPTIVLKDGQPILTIGAAGGPKIITQVALALVRRIDLEMPLESAIDSARYHHQWRPDRLQMEWNVPNSIAERLRRRGHVIDRSGDVGIMQGVSVDSIGRLRAVNDRRVPGLADGL
jgi:gamma-glutamyltranspeptidase/glutathione hydrolase